MHIPVYILVLSVRVQVIVIYIFTCRNTFIYPQVWVYDRRIKCKHEHNKCILNGQNNYWENSHREENESCYQTVYLLS